MSNNRLAGVVHCLEAEVLENIQGLKFGFVHRLKQNRQESDTQSHPPSHRSAHNQLLRSSFSFLKGKQKPWFLVLIVAEIGLKTHLPCLLKILQLCRERVYKSSWEDFFSTLKFFLPLPGFGEFRKVSVCFPGLLSESGFHFCRKRDIFFCFCQSSIISFKDRRHNNL